MSLASDFTYPPQDNGEPRDRMYDKIIISAITCLFIVTFLFCLRFVYVSWVSEQPTTSFRRTRRRLDSTGPRFYFTGQEPERLRNVGLDSVILETLPIFLYKSQNFTDGLECAVCLCGFEENEKGRLLPNCRHSFHVECIDMWFLSHSTCPLCRTAAQPEQPVDMPMMPDGFSFTRLRSLTRMVSRDRARTQVFDRSPELTVSLSSGEREGAQVFSSD